ncbi:MAG TPA: hypothetical protein VE890_02855 [Thermoguttaceae bacterium]|nr:hypothetical protein [Thermoguttaceae bacterium]
MDDRELGQPLAQPPEQPHSPFAEEPIMAEAVAVEPEEPRLGIMHLLVWTACVAVYFSFLRTMTESGQEQFLGSSNAVSVFYGLGMGTALAGLVLLVSRRLRGFPLAKHPGEYLLLLFGVSLIASVVIQMIIVRIGPISVGRWSWAEYALMGTSYGMLAIDGLILLIATVRVKILHWRVFFVIMMMTLALQFLGPLILARFLSVRSMGVAFQLIPQIDTVLLTVVVLIDLWRSERYPWQHWFGIGLRFWFGAFAVGRVIYVIVSGGFLS